MSPAHLSLNAEAIGNLVHWARTGEERPMYASPEQRSADIEAGALRPVDELLAWFEESAQVLADAMAELTDEQWQRAVARSPRDERSLRPTPRGCAAGR